MKSVQFITHHNDRYGYAEGAEMALRGGCRWVQLRMKDADDEAVRTMARRIMPLCRELGATFVIDDRVELARELGADGVHLGKDDMPVAAARAILGPQAIIGATANTVADALAAVDNGADYIGYGPFRFTTTKERLAPRLGLAGYRNVVDELAARHISTPIVAIGGITIDDVTDLMATGVASIAISGAVLNAPDPTAMMAQFIAKTKSFE